MKTIKSAGAVVFTILEGEIYFLLLNHRRGSHWGFPKGRIKEGESNLNAAMREVFEETRLLDLHYIVDHEISERYSYIQGGKKYDKEIVLFIAHSPKIEVHLSEEHTNFLWTLYENSLNLLEKKESKMLLKKVNDILKKYRGINKNDCTKQNC